MKYATGGNGSALQQPGILQRFLPEALVCASQYSPAEGKNSNSRRHLHASETQLNFLRRWGDRINQLLGRRVDAVRASGQKMKWLLSSLETGLLGGYHNFLKGKNCYEAFFVYYLFHVE